MLLPSEPLVGTIRVPHVRSEQHHQLWHLELLHHGRADFHKVAPPSGDPSQPGRLVQQSSSRSNGTAASNTVKA